MAIAASVINGMFVLLAALIPSIGSLLEDLKNKPRRKRLIIRGTLSLVIAALVGGLTLFSVSHATRPSPQATIAVPGGSQADIQLGGNIEGSATDLPHDELFLVLRSAEGGEYYPQALVNDWDGISWKAALNALPGIGRYDLMAIDATGAEARGELRMYLQICRATATCKGVDTLPDGAETLASIPVDVTAGL